MKENKRIAIGSIQYREGHQIEWQDLPDSCHVRFMVGGHDYDWIEISLDPKQAGITVRGGYVIHLFPEATNCVRVNI